MTIFRSTSDRHDPWFSGWDPQLDESEHDGITDIDGVDDLLTPLDPIAAQIIAQAAAPGTPAELSAEPTVRTMFEAAVATWTQRRTNRRKTIGVAAVSLAGVFGATAGLAAAAALPPPATHGVHRTSEHAHVVSPAVQSTVPPVSSAPVSSGGQVVGSPSASPAQTVPEDSGRSGATSKSTSCSTTARNAGAESTASGSKCSNGSSPGQTTGTGPGSNGRRSRGLNHREGRGRGANSGGGGGRGPNGGGGSGRGPNGGGGRRTNGGSGTGRGSKGEGRHRRGEVGAAQPSDVTSTSTTTTNPPTTAPSITFTFNFSTSG